MQLCRHGRCQCTRTGTLEALRVSNFKQVLCSVFISLFSIRTVYSDRPAVPGEFGRGLVTSHGCLKLPNKRQSYVLSVLRQKRGQSDHNNINIIEKRPLSIFGVISC
jgi:hypothetical protein